MAKPSTGKHTVASIEHVAAQLQEITTQVQACGMFLKVSAPEVSSIDVEYEVSLNTGLRFLQDWADALRDAVRDARMQQARNTVSVSSAPVSESPKEPKNSRRK